MFDRTSSLNYVFDDQLGRHFDHVMIFNKMVQEYGEEKAEEMLNDFQVKLDKSQKPKA